MGQQDRKTLKNFFSDGSLPTSQHYRDLVDSMVTWKDDGFDKSLTEGWRIASIGEEKALMSFYSGIGASSADWTLGQGEAEGSLQFRRGAVGAQTSEFGRDKKIGLALSRDGQLGVHTPDPEWRLDVDGVARMNGRIGLARQGVARTVPADGDWHDITEALEGCQALEVMAGVGGEAGKGHYAMIHAIALNAYNPRNWFLNWAFRRKQIKAQRAVFGNYADRLRLRWRTATDLGDKVAETDGADNGKGGAKFYRPYTLQIKTSARYRGADYRIRYYVTRLWFDSRMEGSRRDDIDRDDDVM